MTDAIRDQNHVTVALGQSSDDANTTLPLLVDPITGRLLTDSAASGTVTSFSFNDGNGFDGTVTNATTTPALSLAITPTGILKGSGGAIEQATAGTDYTNAAFSTISVSGQSDVVADSPADTLTLAAGSNITITTNAGTDTITIAAAAGGGTVDTVVGTADRITVDDTDPANPVVDIASTYAGQNTITTLGTITTGTWNGTDIAPGAGGTGVSNSGTITVSGNTTIGSSTHTVSLATSGNTSVTLPTSGTLDKLTGTETLTNKTLTSPVINAATIGTSLVPTSNDGAALGSATNQFSDLFLASGAVVNIANGNWAATHSSGILTVGTGDLHITTAGTNSASVVTVGGTQTLTNKTLTSPTINEAAIATSSTTFTVEPGSDDTAYGDRLAGLLAGDTIAQWDLVYLDSTSGRWELADADAASTAGGVLLGLATTSGTDGNALTVLLRGIVRNDGWTWATVGGPLYVSTTAAGMTQTAPSGSADVVRVVGHALSDDCIWFNPSNDWSVLS
jgi:hypothetical protein